MPTGDTVPDLILAQAQRSARVVAVESAGDRLTYAQLVAHAHGLAHHLRRTGVGPGDRVAVAVPRGVDLVPTLLGVQLSGAAYVPLDPEHPAERLRYILEDAGARVLVTADASGSPELATDVRVHLTEVAVRAVPDPPPLPRGDSAAYVIYTSGSTGRPKGVQVTHGALSNFIRSMRDRLVLPDDVVLPAVTTISFDIAALELFLPLTTGGRVVIGRQHETTDPHRLAALLARTGVRALQATPTSWRLLLEAGWSPPDGFTVLCGGERLPAGLARRLLGDGVVLWDLYGPTETTVWSAVTRHQRGVPSAFYAVRDTSLHVLDERLVPVEAGVAGELYIGGAGLAVGYLGRPALTAERFVADSFAPDRGARLYRTGDVARRHADGRIEILGRTDDQVKVRGFRIEPGEIESVLTDHPGVAEAAVRAIDDGDAPRLVAYLRPTDRANPPDTPRLRRHLARLLPAYMLPTQFVVLDAFPLTQNGKLDRAALPAPHATPDHPRRAGSEPGQATQTDRQQRIADVLAAVLERDEIGPHDDFFALGGDSLRAVQAILRLNAELATEVPINALFEARTVYGLAMVADGSATPEPSLVALPADRVPRLSSAQWRLWLHQQVEPHSTIHNGTLAVRLPDPLDLPALQTALTDLLARHEILRTRYEPDDSGKPLPAVLPVTPVRLEVEDDDPAAVLAAELARPFDLAKELPVRIRLVRRTGKEGSLLLMVLHQIAADGRSRELISAQVRAAYGGRAVPDPALRYADYADWQRELAAGPAAQRNLDFWRTALAGLDRADLVTDRPRPATRDGLGGTVRFGVPPAVAGAVREVAHEHGAPTSIGLLTAFYGVLSRYAKGTDLTVGVVIPGRDRPELADLVGMFETTAVIRVRLDGRPSFAELLGRVRAAGLAGYEHAVTQLEDVIAAVFESVPPEPGRNPLFDAVFAPDVDAGSAGVPLPDAPGAQYDLSCHLTERPDGGVDGRLVYATQLFDGTTVSRFADDYVHLLEAAADDPTRPLDEVLRHVPQKDD
jgi:amino acid adenylation domain-containing protein